MNDSDKSELYSSKWRFKRGLKKTWDFIWNDDSIWSWIVNILLAFVLIKFLLYPGIGFVLGTDLPVVAVISDSMDHGGSFNEWWRSSAICEGQFECIQSKFYDEYNISKNLFLTFPLKYGFQRGDIIVLHRALPEKLEIGDVIVFKSETPGMYPIIHRIIRIQDEGEERIFTTKGDHNELPINVERHLNEYDVREEDLVGRAFFRIPFLGYVKLGFVDMVDFVVGVFS